MCTSDDLHRFGTKWVETHWCEGCLHKVKKHKLFYGKNTIDKQDCTFSLHYKTGSNDVIFYTNLTSQKVKLRRFVFIIRLVCLFVDKKCRKG